MNQDNKDKSAYCMRVTDSLYVLAYDGQLHFQLAGSIATPIERVSFPYADIDAVQATIRYVHKTMMDTGLDYGKSQCAAIFFSDAVGSSYIDNRMHRGHLAVSFSCDIATCLFGIWDVKLERTRFFYVPFVKISFLLCSIALAKQALEMILENNV